MDKQIKQEWVIKHATRPGGCASNIPYCGYSRQTLTSMAARGYTLNCNGKKVPLSSVKG